MHGRACPLSQRRLPFSCKKQGIGPPKRFQMCRVVGTVCGVTVVFSIPHPCHQQRFHRPCFQCETSVHECHGLSHTCIGVPLVRFQPISHGGTHYYSNNTARVENSHSMFDSRPLRRTGYLLIIPMTLTLVCASMAGRRQITGWGWALPPNWTLSWRNLATCLLLEARITGA